MHSGACLISCSAQVDKIAPLFGLDPARPIWLVKKQGNLAVFPHSGSGRFEGHLIQPGDMYEVKGHCEGTNGGSPATTTQASTSAMQSPDASFGVYAIPTYTAPQPHPPVASRKKTWRKTIVLVSVKKSVKGKEKSGAVCYDVITQVVVLLSPAICNVKEVSQFVAKQVDFEVLLDSKGYPLLDNESTSGDSFWKSTRKILAANRQLYRKLTGQNTDIERASIDLTKDDSSDDSDILLPPPVKRPKCVCGDSSMSTVADKIEDISKQVSGLAESITFMQNMQHALECVVCK